MSTWGTTWGLTWGRTWGAQHAPELSSSSGVRRLELYKLQEESLSIKDAVKSAIKVEEKQPTLNKQPNVIQLKPRSTQSKKRATVAPQRQAPIVPLRVLPPVTAPSAYEYLAQLPPLAINFYIETVQELRVLVKKKKNNKKRVAAFLLLAA